MGKSLKPEKCKQEEARNEKNIAARTACSAPLRLQRAGGGRGACADAGGDAGRGGDAGANACANAGAGALAAP